ncbi:hypothetical protein FRC04_000823 [Tulasnella sp. 424]|nr:hypothetical protein FRC04_000823 [Tulasnella sp. 424]KAG8969419.1 hypothetical protein FRC05_001054 [Tulasnella sp. 425]
MSAAAPATHPYGRELDTLLHHLKHLPTEVPEKHGQYHFDTWLELDPELVEDTGSRHGALNMMLERAFGTRKDGLVAFRERGTSLEAVAGVIRREVTGLDGENVLLTKWTDDLTAAAKAICEKHGTKIPRESKMTEKKAIAQEEKRKKDEVISEKAVAKAKRSATMAESGQVVNWPPQDLEDNNEPKARNGRPTAEILDKYTQQCKSNATQADKDIANKHLGSTALAARVEELDEKAEQEKGFSRNGGGRGESVSIQGGGTVSVAAIVRREGLEQLNTRFNSAVLQFICAGNLPPSIVKLKEWHNMIFIANSTIKMLSATTFSDSAIPKEAAYVVEKTYEHLKKGRNHTLTFDGATTRYPQSVYTVHVTAAKSREAYLIAGNEASTASHTGEHLRDVLVPIMTRIGPTNFSAIGGDGAANVQLAKKLIVAMWNWIIKLTDPCHHMSNTGKDIGKLEYFSEAILLLRKLIKFFKKSTKASNRLSALRVKYGIKQGLVSIGKTRFLTFYYSASSVLRCLPLIRELVSSGALDTSQDTGISWMKNRSKVHQFETSIIQLKTLLEPLARAVKCLESSRSTLADVYLFWLAVTATYTDLFKKNSEETGINLPDEVVHDVRRIVNGRYKEMIEDPSKQVYLATFFLHPSYVRSSILTRTNRNPLSEKTIIVRPTPNERSNVHADADLRRDFPAYVKCGKFLLSTLRHEINGNTAPRLFGGYPTTDAIVTAFRSQFATYARGNPPFVAYHGFSSPMEYWESLRRNPDAEIVAHLAIKLFSIVPNSMAEERTVSNFTKLNSPDRANQKVSTLVHMTQICQHYRRQDGITTPSMPPKLITPRWRDLSEFTKQAGLDTDPIDSSTETVKDKSAASSLAEGTAERPIELPDGPPASAEGGPDLPDAEETPSSGPITDPDEISEQLAWAEHEQHVVFCPKGQAVREDEFDFIDDGVNLSSPALRDLLSDAPVAGAEELTAGEATKRKGAELRKEAGKKLKMIEGDLEF